MSTKHFFYLPVEIQENLSAIEAKVSLTYISNWFQQEPDLKHYRSYKDLPILGASSRCQAMSAGWYSVFEGEPEYKTKIIEKESSIEYVIDFSTVKRCINFTPSAYCEETNQIAVGSISGFKNNPYSATFLKKFSKHFLKGASKIEFGDYIGCACLNINPELIR